MAPRALPASWPYASTALALLLFVIVPAVPAAAEQTAAQKLFRKRLLNDRAVSTEVKRVLRNGGFVDRDIRFGDVTGDGKSDALVLVNEGGSAGPDRAVRLQLAQAARNDGGGGDELRIRFKRQSLYRARASLKRTSTKRPRGAVVYRTPGLRPRRRAERPGRDARGRGALAPAAQPLRRGGKAHRRPRPVALLLADRRLLHRDDQVEARRRLPPASLAQLQRPLHALRDAARRRAPTAASSRCAAAATGSSRRSAGRRTSRTAASAATRSSGGSARDQLGPALGFRNA